MPNNLLTGKIKFEEVSFIQIKSVTNSIIEYAGIAVEIALGLIGIMAMWLGIMKVGETAGLISVIARMLRPVTKFLFPEIPSDHPAVGSMIMNISANMLGLGNAATPFGLKAMQELNELNPKKDTASDSMITFLAINTAGLTLIPASAIAIRAAAGSANPTIIIGTSIFGAMCATIVGVIAAKTFAKLSGGKEIFLGWLRGKIYQLMIILILLLTFSVSLYLGWVKNITDHINFISSESLISALSLFSTLAIPFIIVSFLVFGLFKKINLYENFIEGAKEGFNIAIKIIPFLVAMLMAIGIFRASGAMDILMIILRPVTNIIGFPVEALPMALMRPLSGSGSLGIMTENLSVFGPDSYLGVLVSTIYGSTETTFYVLAVYFGSVNIKNSRFALAAGLFADIAGILAALFIVKMLFSI
ncbi:MAG: spore maturation protein [Ignavibacteriales bacterium]|nr:spore maturation protein [Ignavibacteriales bacterium]